MHVYYMNNNDLRSKYKLQLNLSKQNKRYNVWNTMLKSQLQMYKGYSVFFVPGGFLRIDVQLRFVSLR